VTVPRSFSEWLKVTHGIEKWVVARMTRRALERYGTDTTFFTQARFAMMREEHRVARREEVLMELASKHGFHRYDVLRDAFEAGRAEA
jgi:hypothetical protein